jgi:YVTN family beta-propeller protein
MYLRGYAGNASARTALALLLLASAGCRPAHLAGTRQRDPRTTPADIYRETRAGMLDSVARAAKPLVYVPNNLDGTVSVIDPATYRVVETLRTGKGPQHVVPSYSLRTLWVLNNAEGTLTPIDGRTGRPGPNVPVADPYNLYFTPDGSAAIVVAEALQRLDFRDPVTMALVQSVPVDCRGVDHMEFTADGRFALATCEFVGKLLKVDLSTRTVVGYLELDPTGLKHRAMPQDIRSSPDGKVFYVADMMANGVYLIDPIEFKRIGFIATGRGTHGLYPSRDGRLLYIANRGSNSVLGQPKGPGTVTVLDLGSEKIVGTWPVPGGGSPDMGGVSDDGRELWLSGRYDGEVYVFDTQSGELAHRIKVGQGPHGLCVWPQPGRFSLGHTGNMRGPARCRRCCWLWQRAATRARAASGRPTFGSARRRSTSSPAAPAPRWCSFTVGTPTAGCGTASSRPGPAPTGSSAMTSADSAGPLDPPARMPLTTTCSSCSTVSGSTARCWSACRSAAESRSTSR